MNASLVLLEQWLVFEADLVLYLAAGVSFSIVSGFISWCFLQTHFPIVDKMPMVDFTEILKEKSSLYDAFVSLTQVHLLDEKESKDKFASYTVVLTWNTQLGMQTKTLHKRYSEFARLVENIKQELKEMANRPSIPALPPKSFLRQTNPSFLEKRRERLQLFMQQVVSDPTLAELTCIRQFCDLS